MNDSDNLQGDMCRALWEFPSEPAENFFSIMNDLNNSARMLCLIASSVKLGLFDALDEWKTEEEIEKIILYPHPVSDIMQCLVESGLVLFNDGKIRNTDIASVYLSHHSPYFQGAYLEKMIQHLKDLWTTLPDLLVQGPVHYNEEHFFSELSLPSMAQNAKCGRLQQVVQAVSSLPSFMKMKKMIDLGGGHGLYAIALACKNPILHAIIFDLPGVVSLATRYISEYSVEDRVNIKGGNFFYDPIGTDFDLILSSSNPSGKSPDMVRKISDALKNGGYFVSIQPGEDAGIYHPMNDLEFSLWTFENSTVPKKAWSKNKKFLTDEYLSALEKNNLLIHSITKVSDPYIRNYYVTMLIAKKLL